MNKDTWTLLACALGWVLLVVVLVARWRSRKLWERAAERERQQYPVRISLIDALKRYECRPDQLDEKAAADGWVPLQHHAGYGRKKGNKRVAR